MKVCQHLSGLQIFRRVLLTLDEDAFAIESEERRQAQNPGTMQPDTAIRSRNASPRVSVATLNRWPTKSPSSPFHAELRDET